MKYNTLKEIEQQEEMENFEEVQQQEMNEEPQEVNKEKQEEQHEETKKVEIELWGLDESFFEEEDTTPTRKRRRTLPHPSAYKRSQFYNSKPPAPTPSETTMATRPLQVFTVPIPQGHPVKKRLRVAIWID